MQRLTLIRHATTAAVRAAAFPLDEPLDAAGKAAAGALRGAAGRGEPFCGPSRRATETARLLGLRGATITPALDECDFGRWRGHTLAELHEHDPASVGAWFQQPGSAPHGGESLAAFCARVGAWLDARGGHEGRTVAVTSGGVIRAAVVHALGGDPLATWRVDASPLHATVLHATDGRWTVHAVNVPLAALGRARPPAATAAPAAEAPVPAPAPALEQAR